MRYKNIYADYAATTLVDKRVIVAMLPFFDKKYGNPASMHRMGQNNLKVLEKCRRTAADFIGAKPNELTFTSSASESNNLALKGVMWANKSKGNHLIVSSVEHDCVLESARWLSKNGVEVTYLPVDEYGMVDPKSVEKAIKKNTVLVSVMHANNEIGTINPVEKISKICHKKGVYFILMRPRLAGKLK